MEPTGLEIRNVIERWREATLRGDLETVLSLMTEDALFLRPGHEPMDRRAYAASFEKFVSSGGARIEQEIRETGTSPDGQLAWSWSHISIVVQPPGGEGQSRAGDVLTIFRKSASGQWQLHRDANMLG